MDERTGDLYPTKEAAIAAGVPDEVLVTGTIGTLRKLSKMVKSRNRRNAARKAKRDQQHASRKRNRR